VCIGRVCELINLLSPLPTQQAREDRALTEDKGRMHSRVSRETAKVAPTNPTFLRSKLFFKFYYMRVNLSFVYSHLSVVVLSAGFMLSDFSIVASMQVYRRIKDFPR